MKKIMAIASGGGHWIQLRRLFPAFDTVDRVFVTVQQDYQQDIPANSKFYAVRDATRWDKWGLIILSFQLIKIILKERPDIVITTGAAPGYLALRIAKLLCNSKTVWIDSIANVEHLSLSGQKVGAHVDLWLTQWEHLAHPDGPHFIGAVI